MHLSQRMMLSLFCGVAAVSMAFAAYQVQAEMHALSDEIQRQAIVLAKVSKALSNRYSQRGLRASYRHW
jgi:cell division protein FtsL